MALIVATSLLFLPASAAAQSFSGAVRGTVTDPQEARVPGAELVLRNQATGVALQRLTADDGTYAFANLAPGTYALQVRHPGFTPHRQREIEVRLGAAVRLDLRLRLGTQTETIEVEGSSALSFDSGSKEDGISPDTLEALPLLVSGTVRSSAGFAVLMPGVTTGGQTALWGLLDTLYERVKGSWEERFERRYGFWRGLADEAVARYLDCGIWDNGFARVRCRKCPQEFLVAFSCKGRGLCPSCGAKRAAEARSASGGDLAEG